MTRFDVEIDVVDNGIGRVVAESDMPVGDLAVEPADFHRIARITDRIGSQQNLIYSLHRRQALLNGVCRFRQVFGGVDDTVENHHVVYERRGVDRRPSVENQRAAEPEDNGDCERSEKFAHRMGETLAPRHSVGHLEELLSVAPEATPHLRFGVESLDNAQSAERFFDETHYDAPFLLSLERLAFESLADLSHHQSGQRQQNQHEQRQLPAYENHRRQTDDNHDRVLEQHVEAGHHTGFDLGDVAAHSRHDIALAFAGEEAYRKAKNLLIHRVAYVADNSVAQRNDKI